jgi:hypothetical protein
MKEKRCVDEKVNKMGTEVEGATGRHSQCIGRRTGSWGNNSDEGGRGGEAGKEFGKAESLHIVGAEAGSEW